MSIIIDGTTIADYSAGVNVDGTAMTEVYIDGTKVWTRHPYPVGTDVFSFSWTQNGYIGTLLSYYNTYPLVFASTPYYSYGGGYADSLLNFTLSSGFIMSYLYNAQQGGYTYSPPYTVTGGAHYASVGRTVSGVSSPQRTFQGNGGSGFTITYVGN